MERMWRKVNQGLISKPSASGKIRSGHQSVAAMLAAQQQQQAAAADGAVGPSMPSATSAFVPVPASSSTTAAASFSATMMMLNGHHNHQSLQQQRSMAPASHHQSMMRSSTGAVHRVSRRSQQVPGDGGSQRFAGRAAAGAVDGGAASSAPDQFSLHVRHPANANSITSTESRRRRRRKSKTRCNKNNSLRMNPSSSNVELIATKETSLRERALSKFKLLNFNINWNMHITGCRPCRSNNSNIITRRLCRNRSRIDDNELYRSNSFKFERFKRKDVAGENATNTMPRPVSVCDDYSLPVDFVKKIDPNAAILGSAKSLHLPTSHTAPSPLTADIAGSAGHLDRHPHGSEQRLPKVISGYSHPKDHQIEVVEECESNDQLCSSANSSLPESSEDEAEPPIASGRNSPESITEDPVATRLSTLNPSPYYYSDLLAKNNQQQAQSQLAQPQHSIAQSVRDEPIYAIRYKQPTTLDQRPPKKKVYSQKRYSVVEEGVHIIKCETPSTSSTSDDSNCTECRTRREQDYHDHHQQQQLQSASVLDYPLQRSNSADYVNELHHQQQQQLHHDDNNHHHQSNNSSHHSHHQHNNHHHHHHSNQQFGHPMPPHRLLDPTLCACTGSGSATGADGNGADDNDDFQEIFRPRSIFYVHDDNENGCADCCLSHSDSGATGGTNTTNTTTTTGNRSTARGRSRDRHHHANSGSMKNGSRCGLYETAFDSKVGRSDDDLDELSRINSRELLNDVTAAGGVVTARAESKHRPRTAKHGLRLKSSHSTDSQEFEHVRRHPSGRHHHQLSAAKCDNDAAALAQDFEQMQINAILNGDMLTTTASTTNLPSTSTATVAGGSTTTAAGPGRFQLQLQLRQQQQQQQHPPSPPSTAPLPLKFSHHHHHHHNNHHHMPTDGMFAGVPNNNQSAPDLPHHRMRTATSVGSGGEADADGAAAAAHDTATGTTALATPAPFATPPAQQHSRLRQLRQHHHSTSGEQQGGSSGTLHSDSSSMTGGAAGAAAHHRTGALRALRPHKERPQSMIVGGAAKKPHPLKNKRCQLREHVRLKTNYSSTESMNTSSSGGSMDSLRSSNSEGNRSTTSYESRHSTSLSSHSSDSGSRALYPLRTAALIHSKMHILSPISDKSSLEHNAEMGGESSAAVASTSTAAAMAEGGGKPQQRRLFVPNRTHLLLAGGAGDQQEILGSDSGISLQSRDGARSKSAFQPFSSMAREKLSIGGGSGVGATGAGGASGLTTTSGLSMPDDIASLPFDMPKLVRRRQQLLEQKQCTSDSATSVDLGDLPFDMPKLKRRLRQTGATTTQATIGGGLAFPMNPTLAHLMPGAHTSAESSGLSHASSSQSMRDDKLSGMFRQNLTLHFNPEPANATCLQLDVSRTSKGLHLNLAGAATSAVDGIDVDVPLERQSWYHGAITRIEAENILRPLNEGCFLVRNCESSRQDFSLSLKSAKGFMHMRIQQNDSGQYILGQFSQPFGSISEIIRHYCLNRLPVRGAEHMCLLEPVAAQLL